MSYLVKYSFVKCTILPNIYFSKVFENYKLNRKLEIHNCNCFKSYMIFNHSNRCKTCCRDWKGPVFVNIKIEIRNREFTISFARCGILEVWVWSTNNSRAPWLNELLFCPTGFWRPQTHPGLYVPVIIVVKTPVS